MEVEYSSNKLKKQLGSATEIKKAFGEQAKKVASRLDEIKAAPNLFVLCQIPAANCHNLKGNRKTEWAVNISPNHRLIFEISNDPIPTTEDGIIDLTRITNICICKTEDYH